MRKAVTVSALVLALLTPALAIAHPQPASATLLAGFSHPFLGLDHLAAMLMVGICAARLGGRTMWVVPGAFVAALIVGALLGASGVAVPAVEPMVAATVL